MDNTNHKNKKKTQDDSLLSKNNAKDIKYRIRKTEEKEAEREIDEYKRRQAETD